MVAAVSGHMLFSEGEAPSKMDLVNHPERRMCTAASSIACGQQKGAQEPNAPGLLSDQGYNFRRSHGNSWASCQSTAILPCHYPQGPAMALELPRKSVNQVFYCRSEKERSKAHMPLSYLRMRASRVTCTAYYGDLARGHIMGKRDCACPRIQDVGAGHPGPLPQYSGS